MIISNIKESRLSHLKSFLELDILSDTAFLAGGSAMSIIDKNHNFSDYDVFFIQKDTLINNAIPSSNNIYSPWKSASQKELMPKSVGMSFMNNNGEEKHYCISEEMLNVSQKLIKLGFHLVHKCPNHSTFTYVKDDMKIQLIRGTATTIESTINAFDMFQCQVAFNGKEIFTNSRSLRCIRRKQIKFNGQVRNPIRTLARVLKYHKDKYYDIDVEEIYRLCSKNSNNMNGDFIINDLSFYL